MAKIVESSYPVLTDFMRKCLFQDSAPSFQEAIRQWSQCGPQAVQNVISELERVMAEHPEEELAEYLWKHCEYISGETASSTVSYILSELRKLARLDL
ncbi:hypothetical protein [Tuwongella immobilis]|uniref:Uncharacterized protein n=1 Tax=Tuwongella immobilis TaxID=692036 RepID=A0A6C2YK94_9BACT|nr:hypothetical protein [Tuwongella immobilis]VIP01649.1 unnamed protein product [Tuwongella immobilis]VTR99035.1 unnamed protein product [Tuwongella immobilis]